MSRTVDYKKLILDFHQPSGTSRGILHQKTSYLVSLSANGQTGIGECSLIDGLSPDDEGQLLNMLNGLKHGLLLPSMLTPHFAQFPALKFGLEMAELDLNNGGMGQYFDSPFTKGDVSIPINGLVWMGPKIKMMEQVKSKIESGYTCIKLKIGAIDWQDELDILKQIRSNFSSKDMEIRVDANGALTANEALEKLKILSDFELHSIEQPIKQGQWETMAQLCAETPLDIALDEELISVSDKTEREKLLATIQPQYIILKPSLVGGFEDSDQWINIAEDLGINWWATSALESNVGLTAIAQWIATKNNDRPQGLGTGQLFSNNLSTPLRISNGHLQYDPAASWHSQVKTFVDDEI